MKPFQSRQRGITLVMSLIMLILITLMALTSLRLSTSNLKIVNNTQQRNQVFAAAQNAIEQTISTAQFTKTPTNAVPNPCNGVANTACFDVNGNGVQDLHVTVKPTCVSTQVIPVNALNYSKADDAGCLVGASQDFGVEGGATNNSMCANMLWDVQAAATDTANNTSTTVNQGVAIRTAATTVCP